MPLILGAQSATTATAVVSNSCRFNSGDDPVMEKSLGTPTSTKIFTVSAWVKAMSDASADTCVAGGYVSSSDVWNLQFGASKIQLTGTGNLDLATTQVFRDPGAWWHICMAVDTSQVTDTNRVKLYVNGTQITSFSTSTYPTQDDVPAWCNSSATLYVGNGRTSGALNKPFEGYIAEFCFVDGQQLAPTSFGEFDSDSPTIWKPIDVSGLTFGDNGCYLDFEDSANLGNDANGGTDLTETNLAATDQCTDTPVNNFATFNPLKDGRMNGGTEYTATFTEGNTTSTFAETSYNTAAFSSLAVNSGKYYAEIKCSNAGGNTKLGLFSADDYGNDDFSGTYLYDSSGTFGGSAYGDSFTTGDIISIAFDADNGTIWCGKNGTWQDSATQGEIEAGTTTNSAATGIDMTQLWNFGTYGVTATAFQANFGNPSFAITSGNADGDGYGNFEYAVPSGYYALCTKNLGAYGG